ncbi:MAG: hypothetical protein IPM85_15065 [Chitinophagaceae bacterium]|nr:hypothetical protein [Chitinophagaceae bacterium]
MKYLVMCMWGMNDLSMRVVIDEKGKNLTKKLLLLIPVLFGGGNLHEHI